MFGRGSVVLRAAIQIERLRGGHTWEPKTVQGLVDNLRAYWRELDAQWQKHPLLEECRAGTDEGLEWGICLALDPEATFQEFHGFTFVRSVHTSRELHQMFESWLVRIEEVANGRERNPGELAAIVSLLMKVHRGVLLHLDSESRIRRFA